MNTISILNRITFSRLSDSLFAPKLPILIGMVRGGHTSAQNLLNVSILDYLGVDYKLSPDNLSIVFKELKSTKPLIPLDLRSCIKFEYPLWGYIANDPGHAFRLKNRSVFIIVRCPLKTFQSLQILAREVYKYDLLKAKSYALNYLTGWSKRLRKLISKSNTRNIKIKSYLSEDLFKSPKILIRDILEKTYIDIPEESINKSISKYNKRLEIMKSNSPLSNPRQSYKKAYKKVSESDILYIKSLYLYEFHKKSLYKNS